MNLSTKAKQFSKTETSYDIIQFAELKQGLGISLLPFQRFTLRVLEKLPLDDQQCDIELRDKFNEHVLQTFTEKSFYQFLLEEGRISLEYDDYLDHDNTQVLLVIGRRGTKSTTIAIYLAFKLHQLLNVDHPQKYFGILPNDVMNITMTALGQDNADRLFGKFVSILRNSSFFKSYLKEDPTGNRLKLWTAHDIKTLKDKTPGAHTNSINVYSLPNSPGVRGENNLFVVMDEFAHFNRSSSSTRDEPLDDRIYNALAPSVSGFTYPDGTPYGKTLMFSSPNNKAGKFFGEYTNAFTMGVKSYCLAIKVPTWYANPLVAPAYLKAEYAKNPNGYNKEYGAEFTEGGTNWLSELDLFYRVMDTTINPRTSLGDINKVYFLGVDFALSNDGTAAAIAHYEPNYEEHFDSLCKEAFAYDENLTKEFEGEKEGEIKSLFSGKFVIDYAEVRYAGQPPWEDHKVLLIEEVLDWIEGLYRKWPVQSGIFDQWSGQIIEQMVKSRGMKRFHMINHGMSMNDSQYKCFSLLLHQNKLKLPYDKQLIKELLALQVENKVHGQIKIEAPSGSQLHDDLFDAIVRSLYLCHGFVNKNKLISSYIPGFLKMGNLTKNGGSLSSITNPRLFKKLQERYHGGSGIRTIKPSILRG